MRSTPIRLFVGLAGLLGLFTLRAGAQETPSYFHPQNILRFADSLYEEGDYLRAAMEYRRYLSSFSPPAEEAGHILFRIATCYRSGGRADTALTFYNKIVQEFPGSHLHSEALLQSAYTWFSLGKYDEVGNSLSATEFPADENPIYRQKQTALMGASLLMQNRWQDALSRLDSSPAGEAYPLTTTLKSISIRGTKLAYKSPFIAGALSSVIPGLGRIYAKRTIDGLYSLITIGLAGWQAYDGFHKDGISSFKGWAFGVLGSILYIGNIYGSAVSVQIYNVRIREKLHNEVRLLVNANF